MQNMKVSLVIPVYFNEDNLRPLYEDIKEKFIDKIDTPSVRSFVNVTTDKVYLNKESIVLLFYHFLQPNQQ